MKQMKKGTGMRELCPILLIIFSLILTVSNPSTSHGQQTLNVTIPAHNSAVVLEDGSRSLYSSSADEAVPGQVPISNEELLRNWFRAEELPHIKNAYAALLARAAMHSELRVDIKRMALSGEEELATAAGLLLSGARETVTDDSQREHRIRDLKTDPFVDIHFMAKVFGGPTSCILREIYPDTQTKKLLIPGADELRTRVAEIDFWVGTLPKYDRAIFTSPAYHYDELLSAFVNSEQIGVRDNDLLEQLSQVYRTHRRSRQGYVSGVAIFASNSPELKTPLQLLRWIVFQPRAIVAGFLEQANRVIAKPVLEAQRDFFKNIVIEKNVCRKHCRSRLFEMLAFAPAIGGIGAHSADECSLPESGTKQMLTAVYDFSDISSVESLSQKNVREEMAQSYLLQSSDHALYVGRVLIGSDISYMSNEALEQFALQLLKRTPEERTDSVASLDRELLVRILCNRARLSPSFRINLENILFTQLSNPATGTAEAFASAFSPLAQCAASRHLSELVAEQISSPDHVARIPASLAIALIRTAPKTSVIRLLRKLEVQLSQFGTTRHINTDAVYALLYLLEDLSLASAFENPALIANLEVEALAFYILLRNPELSDSAILNVLFDTSFPIYSPLGERELQALLWYSDTAANSSADLYLLKHPEMRQHTMKVLENFSRHVIMNIDKSGSSFEIPLPYAELCDWVSHAELLLIDRPEYAAKVLEVAQRISSSLVQYSIDSELLMPDSSIPQEFIDRLRAQRSSNLESAFDKFQTLRRKIQQELLALNQGAEDMTERTRLVVEGSFEAHLEDRENSITAPTVSVTDIALVESEDE